MGNFKNNGRSWRCEDRNVLDHDFPTLARGRGYPYGTYDENRNAGYVVIGTTHQTAAFAVRAIRSWWLKVGRRRYPGVSRLAIEADSGGANGYRCWAWKVGLQGLADEFGLTITVGHYPAGASKWKTVQGESGRLTITTPRDRNGTFEPLLIPKHERRLAGFDDKILALYAKGMSTRDIQELVKTLYGVELSATLDFQSHRCRGRGSHGLAIAAAGARSGRSCISTASSCMCAARAAGFRSTRSTWRWA